MVALGAVRLHDSHGGRWQLADAVEDGARRRHRGVPAQVLVKGHRIEGGVHVPGGEKGRQRGGEPQPPRRPCQIQGLDPEPVTAQDQPAGAVLHDGEGEHAVEVFDAGGSPLLVALQHHLGVGRRLEAVTQLSELFAQLLVVVHAAVEDAGELSPDVGHRLCSVFRQIDDLQAAMPQCDRAPRPDALSVGAAGGQPVAHTLDGGEVGSPAVEADLPAQTAHDLPPPFRTPAAARRDARAGARFRRTIRAMSLDMTKHLLTRWVRDRAWYGSRGDHGLCRPHDVHWHVSGR